jgi:type II secretory pathway pseudopilin PulG
MRNGEAMIPCPRRPKQCRPGLRRAAPGNASAPPTQQRGFTYIGLLIAMAIIGAALAGAGVVWHTAQQREREAELLVVGDQIRLAIARYYNAVKGPAKQYPQSLDDLLRDPRLPSVARYLRKLYYDPITGTTKWGLVKDGNDRIMGVFSLSEEKPIKQANFSAVDGQFEGKEKYSDWRFVYQPKRARAKPAGMAQTPADMGIVNPKGTK